MEMFGRGKQSEAGQRAGMWWSGGVPSSKSCLLPSPAPFERGTSVYQGRWACWDDHRDFTGALWNSFQSVNTQCTWNCIFPQQAFLKSWYSLCDSVPSAGHRHTHLMSCMYYKNKYIKDCKIPRSTVKSTGKIKGSSPIFAIFPAYTLNSNGNILILSSVEKRHLSFPVFVGFQTPPWHS